MNAILKKHYIFCSVGVALCVVGAFGLFVFIRTMKAKELQVVSERQQLATYEQNKKVFAEESAELRNVQDRLAVLKAKKITDDSVPVLLSSLEQLAKQKNITFAITTVQTPMLEGQKILSIDFSAKGNLKTMTDFLTSLSQQVYEVKFTRLGLHIDSSSGLATPAVDAVVVGGVTPPVLKKVTVSAGSSWEALGTIQVVSY